MASREHDDVGSEADSAVTEQQESSFPASFPLWEWRLKDDTHPLKHRASTIAQLLHPGDPVNDLNALLHALSLNEHLAEQTNELAQQYLSTRNGRDSLLGEKEVLEWSINNTQKELLCRRSDAKEVNQQIMAAKNKIAQVRNMKERYQHEHKHLMSRNARLEEISNELHAERHGVAREYQRWLSRGNDFAYETAQERKFADVERRRRIRQLKKLQLAINHDKRVHVKSDFLRSWEALNLHTQANSSRRKITRQSKLRPLQQ